MCIYNKYLHIYVFIKHVYDVYIFMYLYIICMHLYNKTWSSDMTGYFQELVGQTSKQQKLCKVFFKMNINLVASTRMIRQTLYFNHIYESTIFTSFSIGDTNLRNIWPKNIL